MCNLSQQFPQTSAHFRHEGTRKPAKSILHNWWRIQALGFHQETTKGSRQRTETMKNLVKTSGLVLYKSLHYFSTKLASFSSMRF